MDNNIGIDTSPEMLKVAKRINQEQKLINILNLEMLKIINQKKISI